MDESVNILLSKRKDRALAIILRFKELECDEFLSKETSVALRKIILDQFGLYHDLVLDIVKSTSQDNVLINEVWLEKLSEIHSVVVGSTNGSHS